MAVVSRRMQGMPWSGKEEKIDGTGCNHQEMMVATENKTYKHDLLFK